MGSNTIVINSQFKPFSLAEMMAPYAEYAKQYNAAQTSFSDTANTTEVVGSKLNPKKDSMAYQMYKGYSDDLQERADDLMKYGYNSNTARNLFNLKKRYSHDIVKIADAINRREEQSKLELEAYMKDPTVIIDNPAMIRSVDDFMLNPEYKGNILSLKEVQATAAAEASAISKVFRGAKTGISNGGNTYTRAEQYGLTEDEYNRLVSGDSNAPKDAVLLRNKLYDQAIARGNFSDNQKDKIMKTINSAMSFSIGTTQFKDVPNELGILAAKESMEERKAERLAAAKSATKRYTNNGDEVSISHSEWDQKNTSKYLDMINSFKLGYGKDMGKFKTAVFGMHGEYNPMKLFEEYNGKYSKFKRDHPGMTLIDSSQYKMLQDMGYTSETSARHMRGTMDQNFNSLDRRNQLYEFSPVVQGDLRSRIADALNNNEMYNYINKIDYAGNVIDDGKQHKLTAKDITNVFYGPSARHRDKLIIQTKGGERFTIDPEYISSNMRNAIKMVKQVIDTQEQLDPYHMSDDSTNIMQNLMWFLNHASQSKTYSNQYSNYIDKGLSPIESTNRVIDDIYNSSPVKAVNMTNDGEYNEAE